MRDVLLQAERARSFLSGLLTGLGVMVVVCMTSLCDPHTGQRWLPLILAGFTSGFLLLRGRSYVDRWQSITLAGTAVIIAAAVCAVRAGIVLAVGCVHCRRDPGAAAGGGHGSCCTCAPHHLQSAIPQVCGMD